MVDCAVETEPAVEGVAAKRSAFITEVYGLVGGFPVGSSEILARFPSRHREGRASRDAVRSALVRLARAGLIVMTRASGARAAELRFHREGTALSEAELAAKLRPPRPPSPKKPQVGKACPNILTIIGPWELDEFGILTRTVTGIDAPAEVIAPMQAAGRAGGLARARKATKPAKPVLSSPASIGSP